MHYFLGCDGIHARLVTPMIDSGGKATFLRARQQILEGKEMHLGSSDWWGSVGYGRSGVGQMAQRMDGEMDPNPDERRRARRGKRNHVALRSILNQSSGCTIHIVISSIEYLKKHLIFY